MTRLISASALVLSLLTGSAALAQSYTAPAGIPAAAAPGSVVVDRGVADRGRTVGAPGSEDGLTTGSVARHNVRQGAATRR